MNNEPYIIHDETPDVHETTLKEKLHEKTEAVRHSVTSASETIRQETCHLCDMASEGIRKSPLASVVGAAFFGAAVCYLILENTHKATFRERFINGPLSDATSTVSDSFHSLFGNLKFW